MSAVEAGTRDRTLPPQVSTPPVSAELHQATPYENKAATQALSPPKREVVSGPLREAILGAAEGVCHYCGADTACEVDHVRPLVSGGAGAEGNLVAACYLCNHEKSGRTPREWRDWRLGKGRPWPVPNGMDYAWEVLTSASLEEKRRIHRVAQARDDRFMDAGRELLKRAHRGESWSVDKERAELLRVAAIFAAERDV